MQANRSTNSKWTGSLLKNIHFLLSLSQNLYSQSENLLLCHLFTLTFLPGSNAEASQAVIKVSMHKPFPLQSREWNKKSGFQISKPCFMAQEMGGCCRWKLNFSVYCQNPPGKTCRLKRTYVSLCSSERQTSSLHWYDFPANLRGRLKSRTLQLLNL